MRPDPWLWSVVPVHGRSSRRHLGASILALATLAPAVGAWQGITTRESESSAGAQSDGWSVIPSLSSDGRFVAFFSHGTTLVPGDTNGLGDVFVRDRVTGLTERVSVDSVGNQGNGAAGFRCSISGDGRHVAFGSFADNLVAGDTNQFWDVFVHDRTTGETRRVSLDATGGEHPGGGIEPAISSDGRHVAFLRTENGVTQVFVHDCVAMTTELVSVDAMGNPGDGPAQPGISFSADAGLVAFGSFATNLDPPGTNVWENIYVHERLTGQTTRVSVTTDGSPTNGRSSKPSLSRDGRFVAFESYASNLVPNDTNATSDIFVHELATAETTRVSVDSSGAQDDGRSSDPSISADGRFVAFSGLATNLVPNDTNGVWDVFLRDRLLGQTARLSLSSNGVQANGLSGEPSISADGRYVAFSSQATNLVPGDTNLLSDIFVRDRLLGLVGDAYCAGDGSGTPCPCGNAGASGRGCANGTADVGCELGGSGSAGVAADDLQLIASSSTPAQPGLFFQGDLAVNGGAGVPFGDGLRCAGGGVVRVEIVVADAGGTASSSVAIAAAGAVSPGDLKRYQWWYRDPAGSPCGSGFNLSNGLEISWQP